MHAAHRRRVAAVTLAAEPEGRAPGLTTAHQVIEHPGLPRPGDPSRQLGGFGVVVTADCGFVGKVGHARRRVPQLIALPVNGGAGGDGTGIRHVHALQGVFAVLPGVPTGG
jgi:hypothetical protein